MKYYLIEISTGDAKVAGKGIYEFDTLQQAVANFHSKLGTAMKSDLYDSDQLMVIDSNNNVVKAETYKKEYESE